MKTKIARISPEAQRASREHAAEANARLKGTEFEGVFVEAPLVLKTAAESNHLRSRCDDVNCSICLQAAAAKAEARVKYRSGS